MSEGKVYIHCNGDISVGIFPIDIYIDMPTQDFDEEFKDFIRESLSETFSDIYDTSCKVYIDDEDDFEELEVDF